MRTSTDIGYQIRLIRMILTFLTEADTQNNSLAIVAPRTNQFWRGLI